MPTTTGKMFSCFQMLEGAVILPLSCLCGCPRSNVVECCVVLNQGGGLALRITYISILRYAESSRWFTEIKQVSTRSIQVCWVQCLEIFCSLGRTSLHCWKVEEILWPKKTACYWLQQQTKVHVLALVQQTALKNCTKKHSIRAVAHGIWWFHCMSITLSDC